MKVYVVTGLDLGWDCVVGVFDVNNVTEEQLKKLFPEDRHIVFTQTVEFNTALWDESEDSDLDDMN